MGEIVRMHPLDYGNDFRVTEVKPMGERERRFISDFAFPASSHFIVMLNEKRRAGLDFQRALDRLIEAIGPEETLALHEGETRYVPGRQRDDRDAE